MGRKGKKGGKQKEEAKSTPEKKEPQPQAQTKDEPAGPSRPQTAPQPEGVRGETRRQPQQSGSQQQPYQQGQPPRQTSEEAGGGARRRDAGFQQQPRRQEGYQHQQQEAFGQQSRGGAQGPRQRDGRGQQQPAHHQQQEPAPGQQPRGGAWGQRQPQQQYAGPQQGQGAQRPQYQPGPGQPPASRGRGIGRGQEQQPGGGWRQQPPEVAEARRQQPSEPVMQQPPTSFEQVQEAEKASEQTLVPSKTQAPGQFEGDQEVSQLLERLKITDRRGGTECRLRTTVIVNYFPLDTRKLNKAYHYDVAIDPDKPKKALPYVMDALKKKIYPRRNPAYDGSKNMYSSTPLVESGEISDTVKVKVDDADKEYKVVVKLAAELDLTCLHSYLDYAKDPTNAFDSRNPSTPLQCLNVILSNVPALSFVRVGRSYFTPPTTQYRLGDGCILYSGLSQAAILRWKPFVNVDVAHKAFTETTHMLDLIQEMFPSALQKGQLMAYEEKSLSNFIKKLKISYEIPGMKKTYIVNDLRGPPSRVTFETDNGKKTTVLDYFKNVKNKRLNYPNLPTLWVGNQSRNILLPMELCTILPNQPVTRNMTEKQVRSMITEVSKDAKTRLGRIRSCVDSLDYNRNPVMREFGLTVNTQPQEVEARILEPPMLQYNQGLQKVSKGVWNPGRFLDGATLEKWIIVCLDDRTRENVLSELQDQLIQNARQYGVRIEPPSRCEYLRHTSELKNFFAKCQFDLVIVILNNRDDCYSEVKRASELAVGCLTQCIRSRTISRGIQRATVCNILLKINAKLNGRTHCIPSLPLFQRRPAMIMGADVTHPGASNFPSIAAVTASYDVHFFKYRFEWRLQPPRQEMIEDLRNITVLHLKYFYKQNKGAKPEKLVYIRDGVSDGQFMEVLSIELRAIRAACMQLGQDYRPAIVFIVVQKRHRTRFFPKDPKISEDRNCNVPAGTCIDTVVTHPSLVDFYLVSHASIKGVAKPTKYVKLYDDCDMSEDDVEKLMYYLCHIYARCNRSVSYPAPTYYAHHAAARGKTYCDRNIDVNRLESEQEKLKIHDNITQNRPMFFV